jgi:hypothetical protein
MNENMAAMLHQMWCCCRDDPCAIASAPPKKKPVSWKRAESISLEENRGDRKHDAAARQIRPIYISNDSY